MESNNLMNKEIFKTQALSASLEDYLKEIYVLSLDGQEVRVTDLAKCLGLTKPSVNRAIYTLRDHGLLTHEHYGRISLTDDGRKAAKRIYENYKVLYRFLTEVLGVDMETADKEAHLMEHALSKDTRKRLKKHIKNKIMTTRKTGGLL